MGLYATKQVNLGWSQAYGTFQRISRVPLWIGKSDYTASEISTQFPDNVRLDPTVNGVYQNTKHLVPYDFMGIPNVDPGKDLPFSNQSAAITSMRVYNQYGADLSFEYPQTDGMLCLVDDDGRGLYFSGRNINPLYNTYGAFYSESTSSFGLSNSGSVGWAPGFHIKGFSSSDDEVGIYNLFLSSDDKLMYVHGRFIASTGLGAVIDIASGMLYNPSIQYDVSAVVKAWIDGLPDAIEPDPYEDGVGPSGPGGGDGTFDFSSTAIAPPGVPNIGAMDTGMINIYVPSASDLRGLAHYLWAGAFDPDSFKRVFLDPMDVIIGLHIVPVTAAQIGTTSATLMVGNISSGLNMPKANSQYVQIDFGTVNILPKWGAYLDFSPYSKLQLFLPYIGYVDISPDDCMNGSINVKYSIDILGGTCVAHVTCIDGTTPDGHMLYEFSASCACEVPVTSGQYQNIAFSVLNVGTSVARAIMGGFATNATHAVSSIAESVQNAIKPEITRSGGFGASAGLMGGQIPYLILTVPRMCIPGQQNTYIGYPSFVTKTMEDLIGYASINVTHLENMSCTDEEANEIIALLKQGVIW